MIPRNVAPPSTQEEGGDQFSRERKRIKRTRHGLMKAHGKTNDRKKLTEEGWRNEEKRKSIMSDNGNPPTTQEFFVLLNAMREEIQQLRNDRTNKDKDDENNQHKETEDNDKNNDDGNKADTNGIMKTKRTKALSKEIMDF
ncbi:hypothetical protein PIB30_024423 [Stylosanthes scabra]|uniref:Uncharacterized protein n=1 Tax=Stylosanthes scabra TaxID=79078 RepID=A0ABU6VBY6_9FABA|nr:hypothetical protein [Stylosanthes scabra]